jgi:hypothetical protein
MAEAPGMLMAMTRASTPATPCDHAARHPASAKSAAVPAARAITPSNVCLLIWLMNSLPGFHVISTQRSQFD